MQNLQPWMQLKLDVANMRNRGLIIGSQGQTRLGLGPCRDGSVQRVGDNAAFPDTQAFMA